MHKLPLRFRVLKEINNEPKGHNIQTIMSELKNDYGHEKQFHEASFLDHLLSLKENGLIDEKDVFLDNQENLLVTYVINNEGKETLRKYLPKEHRTV